MSSHSLMLTIMLRQAHLRRNILKALRTLLSMRHLTPCLKNRQAKASRHLWKKATISQSQRLCLTKKALTTDSCQKACCYSTTIATEQELQWKNTWLKLLYMLILTAKLTCTSLFLTNTLNSSKRKWQRKQTNTQKSLI